MARVYSKYSNGEEVKELLDLLIDPATQSEKYGQTLLQLGELLARELVMQIPSNKSVTVACTVEDADYLARGIVQGLASSGLLVRLVVFWNKRFKTDEEGTLSVAPILKEYHEPGYEDSNTLVIVKSIISSSCVVRTNLTRLIEASAPSDIFVVAPVILSGATANLASEFDPGVSSMFQYLYFAEDNESRSGIVLPGIGGDIYQRLGYPDQQSKNRITPLIVSQRRAVFQ